MNQTAPLMPAREATKSAEPSRTPPTLISQRAKQTPEATALVMGREQISFGELEMRASQLAHCLGARGAGPEVVVGICLPRSPQFVVAALAIMKCGAAYLPLDSAHPAERLRFALEDSGAAVLVTEEDFAAHFAGLKIQSIHLDRDKAEIAQQSTDSLEVATHPDDLAYVIYTSGSTGQPKGVEITQRNLSNLIAWHLRAFGIDCGTRATFQAGVGFDAAVWEIWPALTAGAALYLPDHETRLSAEALRDWLVRNRITVSFVSTAMAEQLIALPWPTETALRFLLTGADTLQRFPAPGLPFALVNNYGPTECTVVATSGVVAPEDKSQSLPSIGAPIDGINLYLLNEEQREVADGENGEIFLGGAGVARGYRNRPDLTAERFPSDPFQVEGRMYRTGDLGRRLTNGAIAFLGRQDDQVKIRGFRVELGEINAVLNQQTSVQSSVVMAREDTGEKKLVAYLVPTAGVEHDEQTLRAALRQRLPDYMEPAAFVWLEAFPLTANGKIDRAALPAPQIGETADAAFVAPRTPVETRLAEIITEVLKLPRVSVHDDFFELGAHSLLGAQIVAKVRAAFGAELKLLDVFDAPTVAELAVRIEEALERNLSSMSEAEVELALASMETN